MTGTARTKPLADNSAIVVTSGAGVTDVVSFTGLAASAGLVTGDQIFFTDDVLGAEDASETGSIKIVDNDIVFTVTVTGNNASIVSNVDIADNNDVIINGPEVLNVIREARDTDGSYVVDTGVASDSTDEVLVLAQGNETTTRSVTVTAWVDANGNDAIDSTEYTSPTETVTFKKASEIVGTATWSVPALGDANLVATFTTAPVLNGVQVGTHFLLVSSPVRAPL